MNKSLLELYQDRIQPPYGGWDDIHVHLPTLKRYASFVESVVEIGTRTGNSTIALLLGLSLQGGARMRSYDIAPVDDLKKILPSPMPGVIWEFWQKDSQDPAFSIPRCDLLFIDGNHKYDAVKKDLSNHKYVNRFIILHDTDPMRDALQQDGVCKAMYEFLKDNPSWVIAERFNDCNGLTVLQYRP